MVCNIGKRLKILCVIGTRPEAIKMAPVVKALRARGVEVLLLATAQHRHLLDQVLSEFGLLADWDLDVMRPNQNLSELMSRLLPGLERMIRESNPRAVLAQGDTTTVLAAALAAYHAGVPFGHIEAGLRSGDLKSPFPEEGNRRLASVITRWHFAPTQQAAVALLKEGVLSENIHVVGNTVIDALLEVSGRKDLPWPPSVPIETDKRKIGLITLHRRENFGPPMERILLSLREFAQNNPDDIFIYPVHPNPNVYNTAHRILGEVSNFFLLEPLDYPCLVNILRHAHVVFTDSGGLQEEGPALGKPILVFREATERPEAVEAGGAILVGSDSEKFLMEANRLWHEPEYYMKIAIPRFPYGEGNSADKISSILLQELAYLALNKS